MTGRPSGVRAGRAVAVALTCAVLSLPYKQALAYTPGQPGREPSGATPDTSALTLGEAVEAALGTYPSVKAAEASVASARAAADRAASDRWPDLSLRASATQYEEPMIVQPIHGFEPGTTPPFDETLFEAGLHVGYTLWDFGARSARTRGARLETSASEAGRGSTEQALVADVAGTYLRLLGLREVLEAHHRRIAALEAELRRVQQLRSVGRAARVEVLRVESALARARSDREEVAAETDVAAGELSRLTGLPPASVRPGGLSEVAFSGSDLPDRSALAGRAVAGNPAVARARRRLEAALAGLDAARAARWPELELGGSWVDRGSADGDFRAEWNVGVGLSVPLFTGGRVTSQIAEARAAERGAEQRVRLAEKAVERAVDRAHSSVRGATARLESLEQATRSQEEVVRIEKLRLETGTGTQTDYLDAEAELLSVRAELARARYDALRARVELARAVGELDARWIDENLEDRS